MCSPGLVVAGITLVSTGMQMRQQSKNQSAMVDYQNKVTRLTETNALAAAKADHGALEARMLQQQQATAAEVTQVTRQAEVKRSQAAVSAEASGIGTRTLDDLRFTLGNQVGEQVAFEFQNLSWEEEQIRRSMDKVAANYQNRLNQRYQPGIPGIDYGAALQGVGSAVSSLATLPSDWSKVFGGTT